MARHRNYKKTESLRQQQQQQQGTNANILHGLAHHLSGSPCECEHKNKQSQALSRAPDFLKVISNLP